MQAHSRLGGGAAVELVTLKFPPLFSGSLVTEVQAVVQKGRCALELVPSRRIGPEQTDLAGQDLLNVEGRGLWAGHARELQGVAGTKHVGSDFVAKLMVIQASAPLSLVKVRSR